MNIQINDEPQLFTLYWNSPSTHIIGMIHSAQKPSVGAPRQSKNMTETTNLQADFGMLNLAEVADILRLSRVSIYRLVTNRLIPFYRVCRKLLFKKEDVLAFLEHSRVADIRRQYGDSQDPR